MVMVWTLVAKLSKKQAIRFLGYALIHLVEKNGD